MCPLSRLTNGIHALFRRAIEDEELDAELHAFLETAIDEKMRSGMSREQATRAARLELGLVSMDSVKDRVRDVGWESTIESVAGDIQCAARTLRNAPGFASVAVLTLALGIGANTAIFGLIDALVLRQLPVRDPDQLVVLTPHRRLFRAAPSLPHRHGDGVGRVIDAVDPQFRCASRWLAAMTTGFCATVVA